MRVIENTNDLLEEIKASKDQKGPLPVRVVTVEHKDGAVVSREYHGARVGFQQGPDGLLFVVESALFTS